MRFIPHTTRGGPYLISKPKLHVKYIEFSNVVRLLLALKLFIFVYIHCIIRIWEMHRETVNFDYCYFSEDLHNATQSPSVHLVAVPLFGQNFRGDVVWCTAHCSKSKRKGWDAHCSKSKRKWWHALAGSKSSQLRKYSCVCSMCTFCVAISLNAGRVGHFFRSRALFVQNLKRHIG